MAVAWAKRGKASGGAGVSKGPGREVFCLPC